MRTIGFLIQAWSRSQLSKLPKLGSAGWCAPLVAEATSAAFAPRAVSATGRGPASQAKNRSDIDMRYTISVVLVLIFGLVTPALASHASKRQAPSWDDCYRLGMDRGVHVELDELSGWMDECLGEKITSDRSDPGAAKSRSAHGHHRAGYPRGVHSGPHS